MLRHTFQHIAGIGGKTERKIWREGLRSWEEFLHRPHSAPLPCWQRDRVCFALEESLSALEKKNAAYFLHRLSSRLHWRLYPEFAERMAFLDIETTGVGGGAYITVIGLYDGREPRVYVRGSNLHLFAREIQDYTLLVTYNGQQFDLPFIRAEMGLELPQAHIDLRYPLAALGYRGGLKKIERALGLEREGPLALLDGWCAVLLWQYYEEEGEERALETLLRYNLEDVVHLPNLLAVVYNAGIQSLPFFLPPAFFSPPPPIPYAFDPSLIYRALWETGRGWFLGRAEGKGNGPLA